MKTYIFQERKRKLSNNLYSFVIYVGKVCMKQYYFGCVFNFTDKIKITEFPHKDLNLTHWTNSGKATCNI
jgi:hypothetical protein